MTEIQVLERAITALQAQRTLLGDAVVDAALAPMREKLADLKTQALASEQQRKQATVLFADVSGFSALFETLDTEEVGDMMSALWQRVDAVIVTHGGTIDKHIGDAVMALWGADATREDDPERAIRAALDMQAQVAVFRQEHDVQLAMRVGINTGPVLLGEVRPGEFTAMGDTVNLASRMEYAAPFGSILVTHDTYCHVHGMFDVQPQEPLQVKGKADPVQTYVVQRARPHTFRVTTRGIEGVETRMVGRAAELIALREIFYDTVTPVTESTKTRVVTIVGEAGVGKSRLLHEFENWIKSSPNQITRLKGRTTAEMQNIPYSIVRDMFAFRFDIRESDSPAVALEKFRANTASILKADKADVIGHLIGFDFSTSHAVRNLLDSDSFAQLAIADLSTYLRAITTAPSVIFLEDIHWADDSSLDLIDHVVTAIPDAPLLIVCLTRRRLFERRPGWGDPSTSPRAGDHEAHTRIDLKPLSRQASRALVSEILRKVDHIPDALRDLIVKGAEGNPFYVEELIKMLIEDGVIARGEEQWCVELDRLTDVRVPPTLTGVLQARLDNLPQDEKIVLQRASVVGRRFWGTIVADLGGDKTDAAQVDALLEAVRGRGLIFCRERSAFADTSEYVFKHAILRDVIYETVLLKTRRVYHEQVAGWLEAYAGKRANEYLSLIAGHYELAGNTAAAVIYLRRSGKEALRISAYRDAARAFERALALFPIASRDQETLLILAGDALLRLDDYAKASQHLERGLALARQHGNNTNCAAALNYLGMIARRQGNYDRARSHLEESLGLAHQADDWVRIARILHELGWLNIRQGAYSAARDDFGESLTLCQALGDRRGLARALSGLGAVAQMLAEYEEAKAHYTEGILLCRELGDRLGTARTLGNLGEAARLQGDYATAQRCYQESLGIGKEIGAQWVAAITLDNLGHVSAALGDYGAATPYYLEAIQIAMSIKAIPVALDSLAGLTGVMAARTGQSGRRLELMGLILHHPSLTSETRLAIEPILDDLRTKLPPDVVEAALERGKLLDLEQVVAEILKDSAF